MNARKNSSIFTRAHHPQGTVTRHDYMFPRLHVRNVTDMSSISTIDHQLIGHGPSQSNLRISTAFVRSLP